MESKNYKVLKISKEDPVRKVLENFSLFIIEDDEMYDPKKYPQGELLNNLNIIEDLKKSIDGRLIFFSYTIDNVRKRLFLNKTNLYKLEYIAKGYLRIDIERSDHKTDYMTEFLVKNITDFEIYSLVKN